MNMPVQIAEDNGQVTATVLGAPDIQATGSSRLVAINKLRLEVNRLRATGEIVDMELEPEGIMALAGAFEGDESLIKMCDDIYREREREKNSLNFE